MPRYLLDVADVWGIRGTTIVIFIKINIVLGMRSEMLVFRLVLLVNWFDYVNAGWTSEMRVTWEVCNDLGQSGLAAC